MTRHSGLPCLQFTNSHRFRLAIATMNRQLPFSITAEQKQQFSKDGVVCLHGLFDDEWISLLTAGIEQNLSDPGRRSRIWDRTDDNRTVFYDSDNWRRISEYEQFVYHSPCVDVATTLLNTDSVNFFFDAIFVRSTGVTFPTPWHQDEPYWSAGGLDTISIWMPLVPVSSESALAFVPGSHLWPNHYRQQNFGELNPDQEPNVDGVSYSGDWEPFPDIDSDRNRFGVISWEMAPGDCVAFNGRIIHGGSGALAPDRALKVFNTQWLGDDVRVNFRSYGMDPDHSEKMRAAGLSHGDRLDDGIYPRLPQIQPSAPF